MLLGTLPATSLSLKLSELVSVAFSYLLCGEAGWVEADPDSDKALHAEWGRRVDCDAET